MINHNILYFSSLFFRFDLQVFISLVLWQLVLIYTLPVGYWAYEMALVLIGTYRASEPPSHWTLDEVQVRILTIDNESVVQETVDALPPELTDVYVVAETNVSIDGAKVVVVPDAFECEATYKGRALEWARRSISIEKQYILYLDEDTIASGLKSIPNADIVQFRERPARTGSVIPYLAEIHRVGFNVEQLGFPYLAIPLYAWGGGIAIRATLDQRVTWDVDTIVEDSVFVWRARLFEGASFYVSDTSFENQAPPTVRAMVNQRRRWLTGTRMQQQLLPYDYRLLYNIRDVGWSVSVFAPFIWGLSVLEYAGLSPLSMRNVLLPAVYLPLSFILLGFVYVWSIIGLRIYRERWTISALLVLLTPFIVILHSVGALYGLVRPVKQFDVTEKVTTGTTLESTPER